MKMLIIILKSIKYPLATLITAIDVAIITNAMIDAIRKKQRFCLIEPIFPDLKFQYHISY